MQLVAYLDDGREVRFGRGRPAFARESFTRVPYYYASWPSHSRSPEPVLLRAEPTWGTITRATNPFWTGTGPVIPTTTRPTAAAIMALLDDVLADQTP